MNRRKIIKVGLVSMLMMSFACHAEENWVQATDTTPIKTIVPISPIFDKIEKFRGLRIEFNYDESRPKVPKFSRLIAKQQEEGVYVFHRRVDNGIAGSGMLIRAKVSIVGNPDTTEIKFQPIEQSTYQQGLFLKTPVPYFSLQQAIRESEVYSQFEIDSTYAVESIRGSLQRLAKPASVRVPATLDGKISKESYEVATKYGAQLIGIDLFPYRNGTKLIVRVAIKAAETSPGVIDFGILQQEIGNSIRVIVES